MIRLAVFLLLLPFSLAANALPTIHEVHGFDPTDVLNVRAAPDATAEIFGTLELATRIEVIEFSEDGKWARINIDERSGWVARRFLEELATPSWPPDALSCYGTEPFWSLRIRQEQDVAKISFKSMDEGPRHITASQWQMSENRTDHHSIRATDGSVSAIVIQKTCSDGMSDRLYGLSIDILMDEETPRHLTGCCTLLP